MSVPELAVRRPVTMIMLLVCIMIIGGIAITRIPLAFLPEVDAPFIGVRIPYPNANPWQIEREIVKPVEEVLATLPSVKKLRATATADSAELAMEFDWGLDLDVVRMQVGEKMDQIRPSLPEGIGEIFIFSFNTSDIPVVEARIAAEGVDLSSHYDLIEARIINRLQRVPGVARVDVNGVAPPEIKIDLILDQVKAHGVDVQALIGRLQGASSNMVLGQVDEEGMRYSIRAVGAFDSVEAIRDMVIDERGLRVSDIAAVTYEEPLLEFGRHLDGRHAVALNVFKESTANTVDVVHAVMKVINDDIANDPLLQGIRLFTWNDQADQIVGGIRGLTQSGLLGGVFAILVLYFFLRRFSSTLIVSLSIPFSIIAACGVMYFLGKTLNVLSMMGLMLGVGMLVDNAIVVLESIDRRQRDEKDPRKAAIDGAGSVAVAVMASTATSLIVFLPLIIGGKSELTVWLGEVGVAISLALLCSLFASLTMIPLMSAHFLRSRTPKPNRIIEALEERYVRLLAWTLRHRVKTFFVILLVVVLTIVPFATDLVDKGMFTAAKNERIRLAYEFKDFAYKSDAERAVNTIEAFLEENREELLVGGLYSYFSENDAATWITLARDDMSDNQVKDLRVRIREKLPELPGVRVFFNEDPEEGGSSRRFAVKFFGQDAGILQGLAEEAERRLETLEGLEDLSAGLNRGRNEIQVVVDRARAARMGLTAGDLSDIFSFTLGGMRLSRFNAGNKEVETWLALRQEDRENLEDLRSLQIRTPAGRDIVLGDVAEFQVVRRANAIRRENRKVRVAVVGTYEGDRWDDRRKEIEGLMNAFELPPGYSWTWDDRILEQDTQGKEMGINYLLALMLVYLVMASLFESLSQPFSILFSIPFAIPGAIWFLAITRTPFNMMAQIGLLILMGIVVNNGIVLLDHMNQLRKNGLSREESILQAGRDRLRAILMTAATTITGLLPLAIGGSTVGGLFYFPLARTVMGGLISSTFLTLIILPYIDLGVEGAASWFSRLWRASAPKGTPAVEGEAPAPAPVAGA
ncbi:MAG TPA: efflux RND transporter permease subunit [Thermoanaerobaculia bacterium]|nr:efflux RND transporter permease subunit [Thermoanaerobaculia bacterium]